MQRAMCFATLIVVGIGAFPAYAEPILLIDVRMAQGTATAVGPDNTLGGFAEFSESSSLRIQLG